MIRKWGRQPGSLLLVPPFACISEGDVSAPWYCITANEMSPREKRRVAWVRAIHRSHLSHANISGRRSICADNGCETLGSPAHTHARAISFHTLRLPRPNQLLPYVFFKWDSCTCQCHSVTYTRGWGRGFRRRREKAITGRRLVWQDGSRDSS